MKEFIDKLIGRLEEETDCPNCSMYCADANICGFDAMRKQAIEIVNQLAEEYNNGWIPCSERLPEDSDDVICTVKRKGTTNTNVVILWYHPITKQWYDIEDEAVWRIVEVIAWQPLPAPYQPKGEEVE